MNTKLFIILWLSIALNGCSPYYRNQSPAPIYGDPHTNPYANQPVITTYPMERSGETSQPEFDNQSVAPKDEVFYSRQETQGIEKPFSPAVLALMNEADKNSKEGNLEVAVSTIERAIRIDSRNPTLTYKLALIRLKQSKPRLAEDLAKKAALLAANNRDIKKKSWLLISEARRQQNNYFGAEEAKKKADSI